MKKILIILSLVACQTLIFGQSNLVQFSPLANRQTNLSTNITKISDGFLLQGIVAAGSTYIPMLYKLNNSGALIDSMVVSYNGKFFYSDEIIRNGNLNYQLGYIYSDVPYISPKRGLVIFDDNLNIVDTFKYNILPKNGFPNFNTSNTLIGDTIISVREYLLFDTAGVQLPDRVTQIERIGLKGETYETTDISVRVKYSTDAAVLKNHIFVFGFVVAELPNINIQPVGEFALDGTFIKAYPFNANDPVGAYHGRIAEEHKDFIYHAHDGSIDQRNHKFELVKRVKLKNESSILSGIGPSYKAFTFDNKDNIFYLHGNQGTSIVSVFKLNTSLEVIWEKNIGSQGGLLFVEKTNDGGCLVGCIQNQGNEVYTLLLYKINSNGDITAITTLGTVNTPKNLFYPNPFQSQLTLQENIEGASEVQLSDMSGRIVGIFPLNNDSIEVNSDLPKGIYVAQIKDEKGKILGLQKVVKH